MNLKKDPTVGRIQTLSGVSELLTKVTVAHDWLRFPAEGSSPYLGHLKGLLALHSSLQPKAPRRSAGQGDNDLLGHHGVHAGLCPSV